MTIFSNFFSSEPVNGQQLKGQNITLARGTTLFEWPIPGIAGPVMSQIMHITEIATGDGDVVIELPPANRAEDFKSVLFVNKANDTVTIHSYNRDPFKRGRIIKNIKPDQAFFIYLESNKTFPGRWFDVAFGASGVLFDPADLAGPGLHSTVNTLYRIISSETISAATTANEYHITNADNAKLLVNILLATTVQPTYRLPAIADVDTGFYVYLYNAFDDALTVVPTGAGATINSSNSITLNKTMSCCLVLDSSNANNWLTVSSNIPIPLLSNPILFPSTQLFGDSTYTTEQWASLNTQTIVCNTSMNVDPANSKKIIYQNLNLKLPNPSAMPPAGQGADISGNGFNFFMVNAGKGNVRLTCETGRINGLYAFLGDTTSNPEWMTFGPGTSCQVISNGVDWWTLFQGASNNRIVFLDHFDNDSNNILNILPAHWGTTFLNIAENKQYIHLDYNDGQLWMGFRINVNGASVSARVICRNGSRLNGVEGTTSEPKFVDIKNNIADMNNTSLYPGGAASFIYDGNNGWWQI